MQEVDAAEKVQLARWHRFLPSPGAGPVLVDGSSETGEQWQERVDREFAVLARITARLTDAGGWDAQLSKEVGLVNPRN
ncbi:MAG TPA: hypothetical protein PL070_08670 [Flavobacteriales bacterium]|nr:hypothetical protein [Flavobacteriales bacterium]